MHPKVTEFGRPIANKRETPRRRPCYIAQSLLAGWTQPAVESCFFHRTCDSVAGFCTWKHHHAWIAKLIDELHHSQPRSSSLFPPIQHRSWKPNAVDTPHIHFGFYGHIHLIWILWATRPPCQLLGQKVALRPATMALHSHRRPTLAILLEQRCKLSSDGGMIDIDLVSVPPGQSN